MNKRLLSRIKQLLLKPKLDNRAPTGVLTDDEHRTIYALLEVLVDDAGYPATRCREHVARRTAEQPGYLAEYRRGIEVLDRTAARTFGGKRFAQLSSDERNRVLRQLLRRYPHPESDPFWRRQTKLTSENLEILLGLREDRRLRNFVVRDLLEHYYASEAGWSLVGYRDFPGFVRQEREPCEVVGVSRVGDALVLELSDATFERLDPYRLESDETHSLAVITKAGRQRAVFSRKAYHAFCEYLEETADGFDLVVGDKRTPVLVDG